MNLLRWIFWDQWWWLSKSRRRTVQEGETDG